MKATEIYKVKTEVGVAKSEGPDITVDQML